MIVEATGNVRRLGSIQAGQDATKFERIVKVIIASLKIESRAGEGGGEVRKGRGWCSENLK